MTTIFILQSVFGFACDCSPIKDHDKLIESSFNYYDQIFIGEIIEIDRQNNRAKVKEINMIKKHIKTTKEKKGGIVSKENFLHISNLTLVDEKKSKDKEIKK